MAILGRRSQNYLTLIIIAEQGNWVISLLGSNYNTLYITVKWGYRYTSYPSEESLVIGKSSLGNIA